MKHDSCGVSVGRITLLLMYRYIHVAFRSFTALDNAGSLLKLLLIPVSVSASVNLFAIFGLGNSISCLEFNFPNQSYGVHTCGRFGSTVPLLFDVSGVPSPFLLFSGSFVIFVECLVSVLERPSCLPDW